MVTKTKTAKKSTSISANPSSKTRIRKISRKNKKKITRSSKKIPNSFVLFGRALSHLWRHKKIFGGIFVVYILLYIVFVKGLAANFQLTETRDLINETLGDEIDGFTTATALFGALLGTAGTTTSESGSVYQLILFVLFSLAIIWTLRHTFDVQNPKLKIRQIFYNSTYPLIPYLLVGAVIVLQLLPALIGITIYGVVSTESIAINGMERFIWFIFALVLSAVSIYLVSSSVFASYIVTLENIAPIAALRSARKIVKFRRWLILRKVIFLPVVIALFFVVVFFPLVIFAPVVAEILFLLSSLSIIFVGHTYLYLLYRELL